MTIKSSISLTDAQAAFARRMVEEGRYPSLSAVLQQGLELLRRETEAKDAEVAALRELLDRRSRGPFVGAEAFRAHTDRSLAEQAARLLQEDDLADDEGL